MQHSFDTDIASEYGILEAILLNNLWYWIKKNEANETNFFDGCYWTYNSTRAFSLLFPYVSERQIMNALKRLKEQGIIKTGNYNKLAYDRTLWYAFTKKGECIMQKCKMEDANLSNGTDENVEPIPNINTNNKTTNNKPNNKVSKKDTFDALIDAYTDNEDLKYELKNHLAVRKAKKGALTNRAIELSFKKLDELTYYEPINLQEELKIKIVQQSIEKGWIGFFEYKEDKKNKSTIKTSNVFFDILEEEGKICRER